MQELLYPSREQLAIYPEFENALELLRSAVAQGGAAAAHAIDKSFVWIGMMMHGDKRLTAARVKLFEIRAEYLPSFGNLPDIGHQVRSLLTEPRSSDAFLRVLEFALPGQRHNRLHFPLLRDSTSKSLSTVVQLMLCLCLGLHPVSSRHPTLSARTKLFYLYWNVLTRANKADLHVFCTTYVSIAKLAVIEYFLHFMLENHPVEVDLIFVTDLVQRNNVIAAINFHMDQFRQSSFADENFNLADVNAVAAVVVEKCTRLWKGRLCSIMTPRKHHSDARLYGMPINSEAELQAVTSAALSMPLVDNPLYLKSVEAMSIERACSIYDVQHMVRFAALPCNIAREQLSVVRRHIFTHGPAMLNTLQLSICLFCMARKPHQHLDRKMRISRDGRVFCSECNNADTVAHISTLGRFVFVHDVCYYFCWTDMLVREWNGNIHSLSPPPVVQRATSASSRKCLLCERRSSVETYRNLLDDRLGTLVNVNLCSWHTPLSSHTHMVYNFDSLLSTIELKHTLCRTRRAK